MGFLRQIRDAWNETKARWGDGIFVSLDCQDHNHAACQGCECNCHE